MSSVEQRREAIRNASKLVRSGDIFVRRAATDEPAGAGSADPHTPRCPCGTFQATGECYHLPEYRPSFHDDCSGAVTAIGQAEPVATTVSQALVPIVPRAIKRMHAWNEMTKGKVWP